MLTARFCGPVVAIAGALALLLPAPARATAAAGASQHGKVSGTWNLPAPTANGGTKLELLDAQGAVAYVVLADLDFVATPQLPGKHGTIEGLLFDGAAGQGAAPIAKAKGKWVAGPAGKGAFKLVLLKNDPQTPGPDKIGRVKGVFDDSGAAIGVAKGKWKLQ